MKKISILVVLAGLLVSTAGSAQQPPRWVQRGVAPLNRERTNDSYSFHVLSTSGLDLGLLRNEGFQPLKEYVSAHYGVAPSDVQISEVGAAEGEPATYKLSFADAQGPGEVYAQLVDEFSWLTDEIGGCDFELNRLYAISERNAVPQFDDFTITNKYGAKPVLMSIIPGLGQIYKGQSGKGFAIMGSEVVLIAGTVYSAVEAGRYNRLAKENPEFYANYQSSAQTFRVLRNVCLITGGALYIYNLIDAAVCKGASRVVVKRKNNTDAQFAFVPVVNDYSAGVGMSVRF